MYVQDVDGGAPMRPLGGGTLVPSARDDLAAGIMSLDGRFVVRDPARHPYLQSLAGGDARPIPGFGPDDQCAGWSADGRLWIYQAEGRTIQVSHVDPETGRRELWKRIGPIDATGVWYPDGLQVTPDGSAYAYTFVRRLSDLYEVEGLR